MSRIIDRISSGLYVLLFGFVFLWITLGFIQYNILFQFLRLWPLFFVVVGIDMIFRKTKLSFIKILSPLIIFFSVFGIIYIYQNGDLFHSRKIETYKINQKSRSDAKTIDVNLNFSSGKLFLYDGEKNMITGDLSVPKDIVPQTVYQEFEFEDNFEISSNSLSNYIFSPWDENHIWNIKIGKEFATKLKVNTKTSVNKLDISNLNISDFILDSNFSENEITVNDQITKIRIKSKGSKIILKVPKGMGLKISLDKLFITDNLEDIGMKRNMKEYKSADYDSVIKKVDLDLDLKFSDFEIKQY